MIFAEPAVLFPRQRARDLIRTLAIEEFKTSQERQDVQHHLEILFERLIRMGFYSVPHSRKLKMLVEWSESQAIREIHFLEQYLRKRNLDMLAQERNLSRNIFLDPKKRGIWFQN